MYVGTTLKAYLDYLRGNVKKAHKTVTNLRNPDAESHETLLQYVILKFKLMLYN